jgi:hypothetical protein
MRTKLLTILSMAGLVLATGCTQGGSTGGGTSGGTVGGGTTGGTTGGGGGTTGGTTGGGASSGGSTGGGSSGGSSGSSGGTGGVTCNIGAPGSGVQHVLLVSVDGLHALDVANCEKAGTCPNITALASSAVTFTNASTPKPSDSFPGLAALITGGTPVSVGLWYDDTWNHVLYPPASNCSGPAGSEIVFTEAADVDLSKLDAGGGLDPNKLPMDNRSGTCKVVYPHNYLRVNTIFNVVHAAGKRTAWSDKHPAYEWVGGPTADGVDDLYTPEVNSASLLPSGKDWTTDIDQIKIYDGYKVQAILNEIDGKVHDGTACAGGGSVGVVPTVFGMNFQSVSVGQKLAGNGYSDAFGTPSTGLAGNIAFVDASIGLWVAELKKTSGLFESTVILITAKHGQAPIDQTKVQHIDDGQLGTMLGSNFVFDIADTEALIWVKPGTEAASATTLATPANQTAMGILQILQGERLKLFANDPATDDHVPDIITTANEGVVYTTGTKIAEHGGFGEEETHVALIVSGHGIAPRTFKSPVFTMQVAPTIVKALGLDPTQLQAVQAEGTAVLPGLPF